MRRAVLALALLSAACSSSPKCSTIHKPAGGCPAGYTEVADVFERDGVKSPACLDPKREECIDVLYPGESISIGGGVLTPRDPKEIAKQ